MSSPYRDPGGPVVAEPEDPDAERPLAGFDASGDDGAHGARGADGRDGHRNGEHGQQGGHAGTAAAGDHGGHIRLELAMDDATQLVSFGGQLVDAHGRARGIRETRQLDESGFIALTANGGRGGRGGRGGNGGNGARGRAGSDATRTSSGGDGGPGGDGGNGGFGTLGGNGGRGGAIVVAVAERDTPLLMLVRQHAEGGEGGAAGENGAGGSGGRGGSGGDSYSWSESESYTGSNGDRETRSVSHRNSGGSSGRSGSDGHPGYGDVRAGAPGADGSFAIEVHGAHGVANYASRYDLRLVGFAHENRNEDCVYEPGERVRVFAVEVENVGGMPTPASDDLQLGLLAEGWVEPEAGELLCPRGLAPGARQKVDGELTFRIRDFLPDAPGDPLEVEESILHRAVLPSVRRGFASFQRGDALDAGKFVIRYPVRLSTVSHLRSLAPGEATRVRFEIANASRLALGASSPSRRVVRVRVVAAADSELGDEHVELVGDSDAVAPSVGWRHEIAVLPAGETAAVEVMVRARPDAPEYRRFAAEVWLELGQLEEPASARRVQHRGLDVRIARRFAEQAADLLLVVNHRTTREELASWEALTAARGLSMAVWDLTRERHLDLDRPLAGGATLASLFECRAIALLDNEIEGPDGAMRPRELLDEGQALRAAEWDTSLLFVGGEAAIDGLLIPGAPVEGSEADCEGGGRTSTPVFRTHWLRFWAKPAEAWLEEQALATSQRLRDRAPGERHIVIHRFAPRVAWKALWIRKWNIGTIETLRTLDAAAGAIVHMAVDETRRSQPLLGAGDGDGGVAALVRQSATAGVLAILDIHANLAQLKRSIVLGGDAAELEAIGDALLVDLTAELRAVLAPGWRAGASSSELLAAMPRLTALAISGLRADRDSIGGAALIRVAARLCAVAAAQVRWWETATPLRLVRRAPAVRRLVKRQVDRFLEAAFGTEAEAAQREVRALTKEVIGGLRHAAGAGDRPSTALALMAAPQTVQRITSDTDALETSASRVLSGAQYDAILATRAAAAERRAALIAADDRAHGELMA